MKIEHGKLLVITFVFMSVLFLADSVQAQWKKIAERNDVFGNLSYTEEENNLGTVRTTDYFYFPGTNLAKSKLITYKYKDGSMTVIYKERDRQKRMIASSKKSYDAQRILVKGIKHRWSYRDANDARGNQTTEKFNPDKRKWERA